MLFHQSTILYCFYLLLYIIMIHSFPLCKAKKKAVKHTKADHGIKLNPKFVQSVCLYVLVRLIYWGLWVCLNLVSQDSHRARNCQFNFTVTFHKIFTVMLAGAGHWYEMCFFLSWSGRPVLCHCQHWTLKLRVNCGPFKHEVISIGDIPHLESKWKHFCWY